ncbi:hypothetical protein BJ508DRAFT_333592 [Ascobolus immersus RN42]|uniref:Uncharacterized protein n=1 Tax=Ascobolus immersus RN42 TaxID=1160509 RepID=A0A3N4HIZ3_ASCIM|nr:hypothetical protein BJ508DRAFT_333592 [Ascobolus immersus RN42]
MQAILPNQYMTPEASALASNWPDSWPAPYEPQSTPEIASRCQHCRDVHPSDDKAHRYLYTDHRIFATHWFGPFCLEIYRYKEDGKFHCPVKYCTFAHEDYEDMDLHYKGPHGYGIGLAGFEDFKPMRRSPCFGTYQYMPNYKLFEQTPSELEVRNEAELAAFVQTFLPLVPARNHPLGVDCALAGCKDKLSKMAELEMLNAFEFVVRNPGMHPDAGESNFEFIKEAYKNALRMVDEMGSFETSMCDMNTICPQKTTWPHTRTEDLYTFSIKELH